MTAPLLSVERLVKVYTARGWLRARDASIQAVRDVSFTIDAGETLGLVGESGSGKSTVGKAVLHLVTPTRGTVRFKGQDLAQLPPRHLRGLRRLMQPVFQDPGGALHPSRPIGASIAEGLDIHQLVPRSAQRERVAQLLSEVGIDPSQASKYPHEFSGGQRQRIGIARALAVGPEFLVCDEPVSALDVSIQAQVLNLLLELRARHRLAYLFIAHDLAVVRQVADRIAVMYLGTIVEMGPARTVVATPRHPYTRALVSAVPSAAGKASRERIVLTGEPPSPAAPPSGCPFAPRCFHPAKDARCIAERPALVSIGDRQVACHHEH